MATMYRVIPDMEDQYPYGIRQPDPDEARRLAGCQVVFLPDTSSSGSAGRAGRIGFHSPVEGELPEELGGLEELTVVRPHGTGVRRHTVKALMLPVRDAVVLLACGSPDHEGTVSAALWRTAALAALQLAARGRLLPGLGPGDVDAWRLGPLEPEDVQWVRELAAAMPPEAHAVPLPGRTPLRLPEPYALLHRFMDAVADTLPRTPAARHVAGGPAYAAHEPQCLPGLRGWAAEIAAGLDAGVRVSLRLELPGPAGYDLDPDAYEEYEAWAADPMRAVVQLHSLAEPALVVDAVEVWAGAAGDCFGPRTRIDALLTLRRAARVWEPLARLLDQAAPGELELADEEVTELLGEAAERLTAAGVAVHWPKGLVRELTARAVVEPPEKERDTPGFFSPEQLLNFRWELAIGQRELTQRELDTLAEAHRPLVRLRD